MGIGSCWRLLAILFACQISGVFQHLNYMAHVGIILEGEIQAPLFCEVEDVQEIIKERNLCRESSSQLDKQTSQMKPSGLGIPHGFYWKKLHLVGR